MASSKSLFKAVCYGVLMTLTVFAIAFFAVIVPLGERGMFWIFVIVPFSLLVGGAIAGYNACHRPLFVSSLFVSPGLYLSVVLWLPPINEAFDIKGRIFATLVCILLSFAGALLGGLHGKRKLPC